MTNIEQLLVGPTVSLREAMLVIDRGGKGIALVVDESGGLVGTIVDGDVRRALLAGAGLDVPVAGLLAARETPPVTAPLGTSDSQLVHLMEEHDVRHVPLLDGAGRAVGLATLPELVVEHALPLRAVVMAGGFGTRLHPLTEDVPKPMLPVGERPLLETIVGRLRDAGVHRISLTTHFRSDVIEDHFGDGSAFGVEISYVVEERPLGTAGALGLLSPDEPLLVVNGDILTGVDFRAMLDYHGDHGARLTVGVRNYELRIPYGLIETEGVAVRGLIEKPVVRHLINAGVYLLDPAVCRLVEPGEPLDMSDLINLLVERDESVVCFPIREYWLDVGRLEDYERAHQDVEARRI